MEKSKLIILVIGIIALVALVIGLVVAESKNEHIFTIGKTTYDLEDFKSYGKVWYYEENSSVTESLDNMLNSYTYYKLLNKRAEDCGVELSGDEFPAALESGDELRLLNDYELTSGEYMRVQTEIAKANKIAENAYELGRVRSDVADWYSDLFLPSYPSYLEQNYGVTLRGSETVKDYLKTVDYRVIQLEVPHSGDEELENESGDASGEVSGDNDNAQAILDTKLKAQEIMEKIKSLIEGGSTVEEAYSSINEQYSGDVTFKSHYAMVGNGFSQVQNGELETTAKLYASNNINHPWLSMFGGDEEVQNKTLDAVKSLEKGEYTDLIEGDNVIAFVYIEDVRDGLEGDQEKQFNTEASLRYIINSTDYNSVDKVVAKKANFEALPGVKAKLEEEKANEEEANTEDVVEASGEGEIIVENEEETTIEDSGEVIAE